MNLLWYLYQQSRKLLFFAVVTGIAGGISGAAIATVISKSVWSHENPWILAVAFFALCLVSVACKSASEIALLDITQQAILKLRIDLSRKLLKTPLKKLQGMGAHSLTVILTKDVDTFIQAFQLIPLAFGNLILILACLVYLAWLSWKIFAVFAGCLLVSVTLYRWAERHPMAQLPLIREHINVLHGHFRDLIEGSKELQLNEDRGRRFVNDVIAPTSHKFMHSFRKAMKGYTWVNNLGAMQFYLVIGTILFIATPVLGESAQTVTAVTLVLLYMIQPISALMVSLPSVRQAAVSLKRIEQLEGDLEPLQDKASEEKRPAATHVASLELRGVFHKFPSDHGDRHFMLGPIDLKVAEGEVIFIVGGNGSGKTTLAMLLLGLYPPERGSIWMNDQEVTDENRLHYRSHFSAVFADFHLFEQLLDVDDATLEARAMRYIETMGISHKVSVEHGKFSTINLSTGQRKRLALVSSYLEDRHIYLFDEWAADQDPVFKRVFYREILPELKRRGKMVFVISHDDAYFDSADRIIKLQDGELRQEAVKASLDIEEMGLGGTVNSIPTPSMVPIGGGE
ncbi:MULTISPECIES: cyclic peptide export ABC transporter [Xanthomonas]|uniref:ABC transporter ATP-binding/permease protein YojI n=1 Tax=Xanthomonas sacchari TaxID=56458 RepID=A0ABT3DWE7_9XANT|nr:MULTISPECIES: cyclic peptide export ABC transporter [Xanthomonas]MCW0371595.1 ABC transporter ATP-binding/permease protein YojI [Xanthomonas sacchari]MCW0399837.1 ABC transporter ATP-binding/permease protein YojI [Xanthomonas sacchari]MCW0420658.1 ABC transporter ATP-binding/permease protein YojI [Xanthomonas sacchari]MDQ7759387.1 cyclic peptide export ABC transporter [Xanthomonas sontii]TYD32003.1 hypothetical protein CEK63_19700 [Xanthomonas sontii]